MITVRPSAARGHADHGWLDTRHTFSFASYHDPAHMGFGPLRVVNEDRVKAGKGFGTHSHRDMEIVSYVVAGRLGHKDTLGTGSVILPGEVQIMSAGTGIAHSEMNPSPTENVHFLQIWIIPSVRGLKPRYDQKAFAAEGLVKVVSPDGGDGSLVIFQDVDLWRLRGAGAPSSLNLRHRRGWVQVIHGGMTVLGARLGPGDGAAVTDVGELSWVADAGTEALLFDL